MTTINYKDTRGVCKKPLSFTEVVVQGLAPGGGLFVPERIPQLTEEEIQGLANIPYAQRAAFIFRAFGVNLSDQELKRITNEAYGNNFDTPEICPITSLNEHTHILELWHGPTSAFKDMALQCLPRLFSASADALRAQGNLDTKHLILVATSGDTGKAALAGFCNVEGVYLAVLYPDGGVSDIQYKQMVTQAGDNISVWGVRGDFDNCQTGVKNVFEDSDFATDLRETYGISLTSANSINWGRLMPQVVYYLSAYAQLVATKKLALGEPLDVCVPTGNFGNILAAYYAKRMGAPIRRLLCASNENCILTDFINTGTYDITHRSLVKTPSPSMDILVSSNLERQLFELTDRNPQAISTWMESLKKNKCFHVDTTTLDRMQKLYRAQAVSNTDCLKTIKQVFETYHYLLDPHTAVAYRVAQDLSETDVPVLVVSTAHWAKFGNNVYRALHDIDPAAPLPDAIAALSDCKLNHLLATETKMNSIPHGLACLDDLPIRFTTTIENDTSSIKRAICRFLAKITD